MFAFEIHWYIIKTALFWKTIIVGILCWNVIYRYHSNNLRKFWINIFYWSKKVLKFAHTFHLTNCTKKNNFEGLSTDNILIDNISKMWNACFDGNYPIKSYILFKRQTQWNSYLKCFIWISCILLIFAPLK